MILAILLATLFNTVSSTSTPCSGTSYSVPFPYGATGTTPDLVVAAAGVTLAYPSGWTINKISSTNTGTITLTTACTGTLTITRTTPRTQPTPYRTQGRLDLAVLESNLDRIEMQMQESVVQGGGATLSSLTLTTPLPVASGGTGAAPPNCGAGVLTSNGTSFSCVILNNLVTPGTTGVVLQPTAPGTTQLGTGTNSTSRINFKGDLYVSDGVHYPNTTLQTAASLGGTGAGAIVLGGGAAITAPYSSIGGFNFYPPNFGGSSSFSGTWTNWYGSGGTQPLYTWSINTGAGYPGYIDTSFSGCGLGTFSTQAPCIHTHQSNGMNTALYLAGQYASNGATNKVVVTTGGVTLSSGNIFEVQSNGVVEAAVSFNGVLTSAGLTSSGPVSGTTGSFTGAVSGLSGTFTNGLGAASLNISGTTNLNATANITGVATLFGGAILGTGGTAISSSFRGTLAVTTGSVSAASCVDQSITVTGAVVGADCALGQTSTIANGLVSQCWVVAANVCTFRTCNITAAAITVPAQTLSCRVFNP